MLPSPGPLGFAPRVIGAARRDLQEGLHRAQDDRGRAEWLPPRAMLSVRLCASLGLPASLLREEGGSGAERNRPQQLRPPAPTPPVEVSARIGRLLPSPC
jgi:hypothetical protein